MAGFDSRSSPTFPIASTGIPSSARAEERTTSTGTKASTPPTPARMPWRALRAGMRGIQEWLSFYFKSPMCAPELYPEHDLFIQSMKLKNTLRWMMGEELITHLGHEYYD